MSPTLEPPLPRRIESTHLEPQLREVRGVGDGTPFTAFVEQDAPDGGPPTEPLQHVVARFRDGAAKGRSSREF